MSVAPTAKVLVIYTGGTIGMVPSDPDNPASPLRPAAKDRLTKYIPNPLTGIGWDIEGLVSDDGKAVGPLDSSSVGPRHWVYMAKAIGKAYSAYDGFVILHGTDTMAYTASALSFLLQNLGKPVIITGSQLPIFQHRTDAVMNFINALSIAGYRATGLPRMPEVAICFGDVVLRGNRTTKVSTSRWQGFDSPNCPHLGRIGEHIVIEKSLLLPVPDEERSPFFANTNMEESVATIPIYPGMAANILNRMLGLEVKGVILRTFGAGNAPESDEFIDALQTAVSNEKIVVNTTQCLEGKVEQGLYEASFGLQNAGVITGLDLTPEAALTKLMWLLAAEVREEVPVQMQISQRGEQSGSVFDVRYGRVGDMTAPVDVARVSQRPPGQFRKETLRRAMLRIGKMGVVDAKYGDKLQVRVFVNLPNANVDTPTNVPQCAGELTGIYEGSDKTVLLRDITNTVAQVHETGRPLNLTLVSPSAQKFYADGVYLTLLND